MWEASHIKAAAQNATVYTDRFLIRFLTVHQDWLSATVIVYWVGFGCNLITFGSDRLGLKVGIRILLSITTCDRDRQQFRYKT
jgi:hypothetical protein